MQAYIRGTPIYTYVLFKLTTLGMNIISLFSVTEKSYLL